MRWMNGSLCSAMFAGALIWSSAASAGLVTIKFPQDIVPGTIVSHQNATAGGFRISPSSEYTLVQSGGGGIISNGIGWDSDGPSNPSYLGPLKVSTASLFVDYGGTPFGLQSVEFVSSGFDDAFQMLSSKGGVFSVPHMFGTLDVTSLAAQPFWTGIDWLIFGYFDAGAPTVGLEQLVLSVDEPESVTMFALGLVALVVILRRRAPKHGVR